MTEKRYRLRFGDKNLEDSVSYILVSEYNIVPIILQARVDGGGGHLLLSLKGEEKNIRSAVRHLNSIGIGTEPTEDCVKREKEKCIDCGSCLSVCPVEAFTTGAEKMWVVDLDTGKCIACGLCVTACPTHAVTLGSDL